MKTQTQSVYIIEGLCCSVEPGELKTHAQTRDRGGTGGDLTQGHIADTNGDIETDIVMAPASSAWRS